MLEANFASDIAGIVFAGNDGIRCVRIEEYDDIEIDELTIAINNVVYVTEWFNNITLANAENVEYLCKNIPIS